MSRPNGYKRYIRKQVNRQDRHTAAQDLRTGHFDRVESKPRPACVKWLVA